MKTISIVFMVHQMSKITFFHKHQATIDFLARNILLKLNRFVDLSFRKANLADIFDAEDTDKIDDVNPTLKYRPPKAQQQQQPADKSSWNVVIAKIVSAFKLYVNHLQVII